MPSPEQEAALKEFRADATAKLAALPERIEAEKQMAAEENRKPFPIVPLTEVTPDALGAFLADIQTVGDASLSETVKTFRRVCKNQTVPFAVRCDQLIGVLNLRKGE